MAEERSSLISSVPSRSYKRNSPISMVSPPMTATARYVLAARTEGSFWSKITHTKEVKDIISKKINVVYKSADKNTPTVARKVAQKKA